MSPETIQKMPPDFVAMAEIAALLQRYTEMASEHHYNIDGLIQEIIHDAQRCHHEEILMRRKLDTHMFLSRLGAKQQAESWRVDKIERKYLGRRRDFAPYEAETDFPALIKTIQAFFSKNPKFRGYFIEVLFPMLYSEFVMGEFCELACPFIAEWFNSGDMATAEEFVVTFLIHSMPFIGNLFSLMTLNMEGLETHIHECIFDSFRYFGQWHYVVLQSLDESAFNRVLRSTLHRIFELFQLHTTLQDVINARTVDQIEDEFFSTLFRQLQGLDPKMTREEPMLCPLLRLMDAERVSIYISPIDFAIMRWLSGKQDELQTMGKAVPINLCFQLYKQDRDLPKAGTSVERHQEPSRTAMSDQWAAIKSECTLKFCDPIHFIMESRDTKPDLVKHALETEIEALGHVKQRHETLQQRISALSRMREDHEYLSVLTNPIL